MIKTNLRAICFAIFFVCSITYAHIYCDIILCTLFAITIIKTFLFPILFYHNTKTWWIVGIPIIAEIVFVVNVPNLQISSILFLIVKNCLDFAAYGTCLYLISSIKDDK